MDYQTKQLIAQAVVQYMHGNYKQFHVWTSKAYEALMKDKERRRLHATVEEIMKYKGMVINS